MLERKEFLLKLKEVGLTAPTGTDVSIHPVLLNFLSMLDFPLCSRSVGLALPGGAGRLYNSFQGELLSEVLHHRV